MGIRLLMMDETANRNLMASVFDALKEGNLEPLFAALNPDVMWHMAAPREFFRFGGTHRGVTGLREYTALLFSRYHFTRLEPRSIAAKGELVWGLFDTEALHQPSGKYIRCDISVMLVVRDGKIVEHRAFFDTASVLMQQGDLQPV